MTKRKPATPYYTLLMATIAGLLSGQALAESAGHISFVYGPVTATSPGGQTRTLHRGDDVGGGERISTNSGRVQIRFTDGGFVALQPNTVFGIDQYVYANKKPEDSSLFFNLVRGGMRTITGVIGHINKASYRVKTPVATIGIRGTEYVAELDGEALHVSVGLGAVQVTNDQGNITLVSGQSAFVIPNTAPKQTSDTTGVGAPGPGSGSGGGSSGSSGSSDGTSSSPAAPTAGNQQQPGGLPSGVIQPPVSGPGPLASTVDGLPLYSFALPDTVTVVCDGTCTGPRPVSVEAAASFDGSGDLLKLGGTYGFDNTGSTGSLQYANVVNEAGISFGEMTNGSSQSGNVSAAQNQFIPYVVGVSGPAPAPAGTVSYQLLSGDATAASRYNSQSGSTTSGTLNSFNIVIDLTNRLLHLDMDVLMVDSSTHYTLSADKLAVPNILNGSFQLSNIPGVTGPATACDGTCSATVSGFFSGNAGSRLGATYDINTMLGDILGGAALTQAGGIGVSSTGALANTVTANSVSSPLYTFAVPIAGSANNSLLSAGLGATFDQTASATAGAILSLKDGNNKQIFANDLTSPTSLSYNELTTLGNISYSEVGSHYDASTNTYSNGSGTLSVGSISNGSGGNTNVLTVTPGLYVPYIVGTAGVAPSLGIVHYSLQGGTTPRADLQLAGTLNHFNIDLDLTALELSLDLQLTLNGSTYSVVAVNQSVPNIAQVGTFALNGLATTGSNCVSQTCTANIDGFFAGNSSSASQIGATYAINVGTLDSISGVAALGQTGVSGALAYQSNSYGESAQVGVDTYSDSKVVNQVQVPTLLDASAGNTAILNRSDSSGTAVADAGGDGTLEWGRWVAGNPVVGGSITAAPLTNTDSLHYVSGTPTANAVMSALNAQGGSVTYNLEGGTSPTDGTHVGTLNGGSLKVAFGSAPKMTVDLAVGINGMNYSVNGTGNLTTNSPLINISGLATSGCASACSTSVSGFFAGAQANKVGLGYAINDNTTITRGAAAFSR